MTPTDPHVSGWVPDFRPADEQFDRQAARLRSLSCLRIGGIWTVWDLEDDQWFAELPVVLRLEHGPQLEVCWEKFDSLSITRDTIDATIQPTAWVDWPPEWRPTTHPAVAAPVGVTLQRLCATSFRFVTENVAEPRDA